MWQWQEEINRRVWRLERAVEDLPGLRATQVEHGRRLGLIETALGAVKTPPATAGMALKEVAMIGVIGAMIGAMWATKDPAGAVMLLQRILK